MPLTDTAIRNLKPEGKLKKLSDGGGLQLWLMPTGSKLWRLAYRLHGRQKLLALGSYPLVSLAAARQARDNVRRQLIAGADPSFEKMAAKAAASVDNSFEAIAGELFEKLKREGRAEATLSKREWLMRLVRPRLGSRPIHEISAREVLEVLREVEGKGFHETAIRLRSAIGSVFRYAIAIGRAENDPTGALRGALTTPRVKHRAAVTDPKGLGPLLQAIDGYQGQPATKVALQLLALLVPRPGELRLAKWEEFDLEAKVWSIPAARTKMRRPHKIPLPRQAIEILEEYREVARRSDLVFAGTTSAQKPISENTLNQALRRIGFGPDQMTSHGFRATFATIANESGLWHADAIERQLAHVEQNAIRRAYARGEFWDERVRMMQWWADLLDQLRIER
ncbi:tyrosine-type recombinase/integrase [Prosthecomicrobium sp. N25]|uniref:tyrosine-type recombinase/integrase n=1 Tax=Prosthecomicrobium sp. N25 TaxID=3129254 RepID=UPI00307696BC